MQNDTRLKRISSLVVEASGLVRGALATPPAHLQAKRQANRVVTDPTVERREYKKRLKRISSLVVEASGLAQGALATTPSAFASEAEANRVVTDPHGGKKRVQKKT